MKKNKMRHFETLNGDLFPQCFPNAKNGGETKQDEQPTLDEIWEWLGNSDGC